MNITVARVVGSPTKLSIQWRLPEEPNGIVLAYNVYCKEAIPNEAEVLSSASGSIPFETNSGSGTLTAMSGGEDGLGDISDYTIRVVSNGTQSEAFVEDLTPFTNYECFITANTSVGEGSSTKIVTATTDESSEFIFYCCNVLMPDSMISVLHMTNEFNNYVILPF